MSATASGQGRPDEARCYNCGGQGHWAVACPEPTRERPAGLEAWKSSYSPANPAAGQTGINNANTNNRKKGFIVTKYTPAPLSYGHGGNHMPQPPSGHYHHGPVYPGHAGYQQYNSSLPPPPPPQPGQVHYGAGYQPPQPSYGYHPPLPHYSPPPVHSSAHYGTPRYTGSPPNQGPPGGLPLPPSVRAYAPGGRDAHDHRPRHPPPSYSPPYSHSPPRGTASVVVTASKPSPEGKNTQKKQQQSPAPNLASLPPKPPAGIISHPLPPKPPKSHDQMDGHRDNKNRRKHDRNNRNRDKRQKDQPRRQPGAEFRQQPTPERRRSSGAHTSPQGYNKHSEVRSLAHPGASPPMRTSSSSSDLPHVDDNDKHQSHDKSTDNAVGKGNGYHRDSVSTAGAESPATETKSPAIERREQFPRSKEAAPWKPAKLDGTNSGVAVGRPAYGESFNDTRHSRSRSPSVDCIAVDKEKPVAWESPSSEQRQGKRRRQESSPVHEPRKSAKTEECLWDSISVPREAERRKQRNKRRGSIASAPSCHSSTTSQSSDLNSLEAELLGRPSKQKSADKKDSRHKELEIGKLKPKRRQQNTNSAFSRRW